MASNLYYDGPPSDHYDGIRFFNPGQESTDRKLRDMLRWKLEGAAAKWPKSVPVMPVTPRARIDGLTITMIGHVSLLIQVADVNILTDPAWPERDIPIRRTGPKRVTAAGVAFGDLSPTDGPTSCRSGD